MSYLLSTCLYGPSYLIYDIFPPWLLCWSTWLGITALSRAELEQYDCPFAVDLTLEVTSPSINSDS